MPELSGKSIERINTVLFIGAGLYTLWYMSQSVRLTTEERMIVQDLLQRQQYTQLALKFI